MDLNDLKNEKLELTTREFMHLTHAVLTVAEDNRAINNDQLFLISKMVLSILKGYETAPVEITKRIISESQKAWELANSISKDLDEEDVKAIFKIVNKHKKR